MDVFLTGFPKKLLVALSIVVIIAMCLMPTEARSLEHKRRHKRLDNTAQPTKDTEMRSTALEHRKRHNSQRKAENLTQLSRKTNRPKNSETDIYYSETKKIMRKLRNTRRFFLEDKRLFDQQEIKEYKDTIPSWVPTVNFVEIYYHNYRSNRSRKTGSTIPERKYNYLMPKLYKILLEFEEVFKYLLNRELDFSDDNKTYKKKRKRIIQNTLYKLFSTIHEVNESMEAVNLTVPVFNKNKLDLSSLRTKVDATECMKNDYIALRAYRNLLTNWFLEFKCPKKKTQATGVCSTHIDKLEDRMNMRLMKIKLQRRVNK